MEVLEQRWRIVGWLLAYRWLIAGWSPAGR